MPGAPVIDISNITGIKKQILDFKPKKWVLSIFRRIRELYSAAVHLLWCVNHHCEMDQSIIFKRNWTCLKHQSVPFGTIISYSNILILWCASPKNFTKKRCCIEIFEIIHFDYFSQIVLIEGRTKIKRRFWPYFPPNCPYRGCLNRRTSQYC